MLQKIALVCVGSMLGGVSRYLVSDAIKHLFPSPFPFGTFVVNMVGCFLIGLLGGMATSFFPADHHRLVFIVGFCGSFTTFSTFSMDNINLLASKAYGLFALNASLSFGLGLLLTFIGYRLFQN